MQLFRTKCHISIYTQAAPNFTVVSPYPLLFHRTMAKCQHRWWILLAPLVVPSMEFWRNICANEKEQRLRGLRGRFGELDNENKNLPEISLFMQNFLKHFECGYFRQSSSVSHFFVTKLIDDNYAVVAMISRHTW